MESLAFGYEDFQGCLSLRKVVVLGFKVSKHGINPNPAKVQGINDLGPPKNVSGVKQILGIFNFIGNLSQILLR